MFKPASEVIEAFVNGRRFRKRVRRGERWLLVTWDEPGLEFVTAHTTQEEAQHLARRGKWPEAVVAPASVTRKALDIGA